MKQWFTFIVGFAVLGFLGCSAGSDKKGEVKGKDNNKLELTAPGDVSAKPGETKDIIVKIARTGFDEDVDLKFDDLPKGVDLDGDTKIEKGNKEKTFKLKVGNDAEEKEQTVKITAKAKDMEITKNFKVKVTKK